MKRFLIGWLLALGLAACGGGGGGGSAAENPPPPPPPPSTGSPDLAQLFMGNSHTSVTTLPGMVAALVRAARPGRSVVAVEAPGWMFLEERAADAASVELLETRRWTHVVLQAQKYSASGMFEYSTTGAEDLIRLARTRSALPILFPEWPRRGIAETQRIYDLHMSIAGRTPACVAPIGQAWDLALARDPTLVLHAPDGNHSAPPGAFLAAVVIATTITRVAPDTLPAIEGFGVDAALQARLRAIAAETVLAYSPRAGCPADP
ncbi:MAG TPA: hypothetical protein VM073_07505 [Usitatibacter sp.]|nr:hypothetical protein [Usitatibacter sp.]